MPYVEIEPGAEERPYLKQAGRYGPGYEEPFDASCEVVAYDLPAKTPEGREFKVFGKAANPDHFAHIEVVVISTSFGPVRLFHDEPITKGSGSRLAQWLTNMGIEVGPNCGHNTEEVVGKKCSVEVGEPRQGNDGRWYNGNLKDIGGA